MTPQTKVDKKQIWVDETRPLLDQAVQSRENGKVLDPKAKFEKENKWRQEKYEPVRAEFRKTVQKAIDKSQTAANEKAKTTGVRYDFIEQPYLDLIGRFETSATKTGSSLDLKKQVKKYEGEINTTSTTIGQTIKNDQKFKLELEKEGKANREKEEKEKKQRDEKEERELKAKIVEARKMTQARLTELGVVGFADTLKSELENASNLDGLYKEDEEIGEKLKKLNKALDDIHKVDEKIGMVLKRTQEDGDKTYTKELEVLSNTVKDQVKKLDGNEGAQKVLKGLLDEFDQAKVLAQTGNPTAIEGVKNLAGKIKNVAETAGKPGSQMDGLFKRLDVLDKKLKADEYAKKMFEADYNELTLGLADLRKDLDPFELTAAETTAGELLTKIFDLGKRSSQRKEWEEKTKTQLDKYDKLLDGFRELKTGRSNPLTQTLGKLKDKIKGAETKMTLMLADMEEEYDKPGADTAKIDKQIIELFNFVQSVQLDKNGKPTTKGMDTLKKDREDGEKELKTREDKEDVLKKWKADHQLFVKEIETVAAEVKKLDGDKEEIDTIKRIAAAALKQRENAKTDEEMKAAFDQRQIAHQRLQIVKQNPGGSTVKSVKDLENAGPEWVKSLNTVKKNVNAIAEAALMASPGKDGEEAAEVIKDSIKIFGPKAFDIPIRILTEPTAAPAERKKAREKILRQVRAYRAAMNTNPVLQLVRRNPFGVKLVTADMKKFLESIELNALRSIRAE